VQTRYLIIASLATAIGIVVASALWFTSLG